MTSFLNKNGFEIIEGVYSPREVDDILELLSTKNLEDQFGVREFLIKYPDFKEKIFSKNLMKIIRTLCLKCHKSIKSIYFNKPPSTNWIVNWHQDLTINLINKKEVENYKNWRIKEERTVVQPDQKLLESIFTIRIHLDDCKIDNGALRIIKGSHHNGIIKISDWMVNKPGTEIVCEVNRGGILLMKPLTLHASRRTENEKNRRVIHIEFTKEELPNGLKWKELIAF